MNKWLKIIIALVVFIVSVALIVIGQGTVGLGHLGLMVIGILGLLGLLFVYNKKYQ